MLSRRVFGGVLDARHVRGILTLQLPLMHCVLLVQAAPSAAGGPQTMLGRHTSLVPVLSQVAVALHAWPLLGWALQAWFTSSQYEVMTQLPPIAQLAPSARKLVHTGLAIDESQYAPETQMLATAGSQL